MPWTKKKDEQLNIKTKFDPELTPLEKQRLNIAKADADVLTRHSAEEARVAMLNAGKVKPITGSRSRPEALRGKMFVVVEAVETRPGLIVQGEPQKAGAARSPLPPIIEGKKPKERKSGRLTTKGFKVVPRWLRKQMAKEKRAVVSVEERDFIAVSEDFAKKHCMEVCG